MQISCILEKHFSTERWSYIIHDDAKCPLHLLKAVERGIHPSSSSQSDLGLRYRLRRLELGLTLKDLSRSTGLTTARLSLVERGHCRPYAKTIQKLETTLFPQSETKRKFDECPPAPRPSPAGSGHQLVGA